MNTHSQSYESNALIDRLPPHLKQFIKPQHYDHYTAIDQAVWRYVMRKNIAYLTTHAHESYVEGLAKTGISLDRIPSMYGMNRILKEIGWAAVAVDGFIPPNAFMEFQAYKVLVIASDIRQLEHIQYTPAPDIIHEAAGHAPIIANPDYAEYLRRLGDIGAKAILSGHDVALYEAVRQVSILKESGNSTPEAIQAAEEEVIRLQAMETELSEMAQVRNLQWWSVEYGLIGHLGAPKIYGAGLLSSIGESEWCMSDQVKKIPYSIEAARQDFDITKPQPQLFVTPDFSYLMEVLEDFANGLSLRKGGHRGLQKLIESKRVGTIELSTGLQVSGQFSRMIKDEDLNVIYFQTAGPTALAYREKELIGHGVETHPNGFASPLGKLKNINLAIENMGPVDLKAYNFYDGERLSFSFESGIQVEGLNITGLRNVQGKLMLIQLADCHVKYKDEILFSPDMGVFNMAIGNEILSAYAGAADYHSFPNLYHASSYEMTTRSMDANRKARNALYASVREHRNDNNLSDDRRKTIFETIQREHNGDWLLAVELLEGMENEQYRSEITQYLHRLAEENQSLKKLIHDGILLTQV